MKDLRSVPARSKAVCFNRSLNWVAGVDAGVEPLPDLDSSDPPMAPAAPMIAGSNATIGNV